MANVHLLPGFGGKITQVVPGGGAAPDLIDSSRCGQVNLQVIAHTGDATQITFLSPNGATLGNCGTAVGTMVPIPISSSVTPLGLFKLSANGTTGTTTLIIVGWEVQRES